MLDSINKLFRLRSQSKELGFTIPELTVSIVVLGALIAGALGISTYFFTFITRNDTMIQMTVDSQNLLRATVEELRYGAGVRQVNSVADSNEPPSGWQTSNSNFVIIIAIPAIDSSNQYIIDSATGSPYTNELVYFKTGTTLYKRTLANSNAIGNKLLTSCPASTASPSCPADRQLAENVKSMVFSLYDQDDASVTDPLLARSVKIDLSLEKDTFGEPLTLDNSIRVTMRNSF